MAIHIDIWIFGTILFLLTSVRHSYCNSDLSGPMANPHPSTLIPAWNWLPKSPARSRNIKPISSFLIFFYDKIYVIRWTSGDPKIQRVKVIGLNCLTSRDSILLFWGLMSHALHHGPETPHPSFWDNQVDSVCSIPSSWPRYGRGQADHSRQCCSSCYH